MTLNESEREYIKALGNIIYDLKKENKHLKYCFFSLIFIIVASIIIVFSLAMMQSIDPSDNAKVKLMMDKCCDGAYCTDTYYSEEDNLCHLTLCEHSFFLTNCTYAPGSED